MSNHNLESAFNKLKKNMFVYYRGYKAERCIDMSGLNKVEFKGKVMTFIEFAQLIDNYIKSGKESIGNSIKK